MNLNDIELENPCFPCFARGYNLEPEIGKVTCVHCDGAGFIPTQIGKRILDLIRHNIPNLLDNNLTKKN